MRIPSEGVAAKSVARYTVVMGLFSLLTRRQRYIQGLIEQYLDQWQACVGEFQHAWQIFIERGIGDSFDFQVEKTHKEESRADDLRRKIEWELYAKALLPESRGDILGIIEAVDRLLTDAEWFLYELQLQELEIPEELHDSFSTLLGVVCQCCDTINEAIRLLFTRGGGVDNVRPLTEKIDSLESHADYLERQLIRSIFKSELGTGKKVLLKNVVMVLGRVSDRAEHVGNRITLVSVKRRV